MFRLIADSLIAVGVAVFLVAAVADSWRELKRWGVLHRG
jgi:lipoprotein signal peptidase